MPKPRGPEDGFRVEWVSTRQSATLPGCSFGLGIGSGARDDARSVLTIWLLTCLTLAVALIGFLTWFVRRAVLQAAARLYDRKQARAVGDFVRQFGGCDFAAIALDDVAPPRVTTFVRQSAAALRGGGEPVIWYVQRALAEAIRPGAFTTFFFLRSPPLIVCPSDPRALTGYQRFILYHELGHVAGFQTSHPSDRLAALADAVVIGCWFALLGQDHTWGWAALGIYAALRLFEVSRAPSSSSAEAHADLWGLWGVEVDGGDLERTLHLHRRFLTGLDPAMADARLGYLRDWRRNQLEHAAERDAAKRRAAATNGVLRVEVDQDVGADFSEALGRINNIQLGGPGGLDRACFASMFVSGLPLAIALGIALPTIHLGDGRMPGMLATLVGIIVATRLIPAPVTPTPNAFVPKAAGS